MSTTRAMKFLQAAAFLLFAVSVAYGQDCPELQDSELGSTNVPSTGLLASVIASVSGDASSSVQIYTANKVCLGQGTLRNMYRTVSIVVDLHLAGAVNPNMTVQVEFQCTSGMWGFGSQPSISYAPNATLATPVRTDCTICISPATAPDAVVISPIEHCAG